MKIGTFLIILLLALVSLGFLINDNFHIQLELTEANKIIASLQTELGQINKQMAQQSNDLQVLSAEKDSLQAHNKDLQNRIGELESRIQSLSNETNRLRVENARLQQKVTQSNPKTESAVKLANIGPTLPQKLSSRGLALSLFFPLLLIGSGVATYGMRRYNRKQTHSKIYTVRISQHELYLLIRHRRANNP